MGLSKFLSVWICCWSFPWRTEINLQGEGKGKEDVAPERHRRGCFPSFWGAWPGQARPPWSLHFRSVSPRGHARGCAEEGGRRTCHLTFAPWPWLTQFIHRRMEGSALGSPSLARASWPDVSAIRERDSASLTVSWATRVPIAWPGGLAQDSDTWHLKVRHAQKTAEQWSQHLGSVISSSGSKPDREASTPPSFCFHLCSHECQDQRLDSGNELAFNVKQIKQESQGIGGGGRV